MARHWLDEIERMHEEMDKLSRFMRHPLTEYDKKGHPLQEFRSPIVNQFESKGQLITEIELPGVDKKDIELDVTDNYAEIKVAKKQEHEEKDKGIFRYESSSQNFYRKIPFPVEVKAASGDAEFKNGILKIAMPKVQRVEHKNVKRLEIK
ncbi:MAG: Hsp20/alpha crystallin family protein [Nanoarchaeota archaeon]